MPDIEVGYAVAPAADSRLGAKGAGEAGTERDWRVSAGP
jgi:carbon-monoxide dehydrogenase large subunit